MTPNIRYLESVSQNKQFTPCGVASTISQASRIGFTTQILSDIHCKIPARGNSERERQKRQWEMDRDRPEWDWPQATQVHGRSRSTRRTELVELQRSEKLRRSVNDSRKNWKRTSLWHSTS